MPLTPEQQPGDPATIFQDIAELAIESAQLLGALALSKMEGENLEQILGKLKQIMAGTIVMSEQGVPARIQIGDNIRNTPEFQSLEVSFNRELNQLIATRRIINPQGNLQILEATVPLGDITLD